MQQSHCLLYMIFCGIYLTLRKCSSCRKSFFENFGILYAYIIFPFSLFFFLFVCFRKERDCLKKLSSPTGPAQLPARPQPSPLVSHHPQASLGVRLLYASPATVVSDRDSDPRLCPLPQLNPRASS